MISDAEYEALLRELKTCRRCGQDKSVLDFASNARTRDGLSSWCRDCHNQRTADWRAEKRREAAAQTREEYRQHVAALRRQSEAARQRGVPK